jgi:tetratricopeptide (TPR) repeat protein
VDTTLLWTAVGSGAAAAGVLVAAGVAITQGRSVLHRPPLTSDEPVRVVLEPPDLPVGHGTARVPAVGVVLRPPTGRLPEHVRGRQELVGQLQALAGAPDGQTHVLAGLGGTGKTTVALELAEEASRPGGPPVWWIPAGDAGGVLAGLMSLAAELGAPAGEVTEALAGRRNPADLLWRCLKARPGWLLVFDNADDLDALTMSGAPVSDGTGWIRPTTAGLVLVTSRLSDRQAWGRHAQIHPVGWLDDAAGAQILTDLAPDAGSAWEAAALAKRLGGLPLALHHAGMALATDFTPEPTTFADYLAALQSRFGQLMGHGPGDDRAIVTSTWELSLDALAAHSRPQARPLLRVLSCLAPAVVIPPALLDLAILARACPIPSADQAADGLAALASAGLITTQPGPPGTRPGALVHPLVSETGRLRLDHEYPAQAGAIAVALLATAAQSLRNDRPADWPEWVQQAVHQRAVWTYLGTRLADADLDRLAQVSTDTAAAFVSAGAYAASEELARLALVRTTRLGADHQAVQWLRIRVASTRRFTGQYAQAEREFRNVLAIFLPVLGSDHPSTLATRYEIARVMAAQGQHEQAEHEFRDVLATRQRVLGTDHPDTLATRYEIARVMAAQRQHEQAEHEFRDVLATRQRVLGPDHPRTLATRHEIAHVMAAQGRYEQAEHEFRDVLATRQRVLGPDHPRTASTSKSLAALRAHRP